MTDQPQTPLQQLMSSPVRNGALVWIGLRPSRHAPVVVAESAELVAARGIVGDRYETKSNGARQVTLIGQEAIAAIAAFLGRECVQPQDLRRNLVTRGVNLLALKGHRFRIGSAVLEYSGECVPCSQMEETFGPGGYNAVRGHGGITARILEGGTIRLGDAVARI